MRTGVSETPLLAYQKTSKSTVCKYHFLKLKEDISTEPQLPLPLKGFYTTHRAQTSEVRGLHVVHLELEAPGLALLARARRGMDGLVLGCIEANFCKSICV